MQVLPPGLTANDVLQALGDDSRLLVLGTAISTTGLVAAALALIPSASFVSIVMIVCAPVAADF